MTCRSIVVRAAPIGALLLALAALPGTAGAQAAGASAPELPRAALDDGPPSAATVAACERSAREALGAARAAEASFATGLAPDATLSSDTQVALRGSGRVGRGDAARLFSYTCNVDRPTGSVVGVALREAPTAAATAARSAPAPAEPDLSRLSPEACESIVVLALKRRWPRVSQISFDSATRRLSQDSAVRADLHGSGRARPAPDGRDTVFGYDCTLDPRDGRVTNMKLSD